MDLYLSFAESKVQFATHRKWQLKLWNRLLGNHEDTDADPRTYHTVLIEKPVRYFLLYEHLQIF